MIFLIILRRTVYSNWSGDIEETLVFFYSLLLTIYKDKIKFFSYCEMFYTRIMSQSIMTGRFHSAENRRIFRVITNKDTKYGTSRLSAGSIKMNQQRLVLDQWNIKSFNRRWLVCYLNQIN